MDDGFVAAKPEDAFKISAELSRRLRERCGLRVAPSKNKAWARDPRMLRDFFAAHAAERYENEYDIGRLPGVDAGAAQVRIANRSAQKAVALAQATGDARVSAAPPLPAPDDLVINATSLGMAVDDPLPLDPDLIDATMTIAEVVAKPEFTHLLKRAELRGAAIHSGLHMIHHQVDLIARHMLELYGPKA